MNALPNAPDLKQTAKGWRVRIRCGRAGQQYFTIALDSEPAAQKRAAALADLARMLVAAGKHSEAVIIVRKGAEQTTEAGFRDVVTFVEQLCKGARKAERSAGKSPLTFRQLGELWTSGELSKRYPDHVRMKKSSASDEQRLAVLNETIGDVPIADFALADAERAMAALPSTAKTSSTRRQYGQALSKVLSMAVWPMKLRATHPLPKGFLPKVGSRPAFTFLYPSEELLLLARTDIPLALRVLYGFLCREGCRLSEALGLCWKDVDLTMGVVSLDENKTDVPRTWALSPGVAAALAAIRGEAPDEALVFPPMPDRSDAAEHLREHLKLAGVTRAELFASSERRLPLRAHDLRASFITIGLANGRSEAWITDRTGHTSSQMLYRYKRLSRRASELKLGDWKPLNEAIPELCPEPAEDPANDQNQSPETPPVSHEGSYALAAGQDFSIISSGSKGTRTLDLRIKSGTSDGTDGRESTKYAAACASACTGEHRDSLPGDAGESCAPNQLDPIEGALADALTKASNAGQWQVVAQLAGELEARRLARQAPEVVSFEVARSRRSGSTK